jgi:prepilin-type N-terminal cleavage/methylation domain-containing protein
MKLLNNKYNKAFTLIELSIVLLIIGLIIGGITAGSSLIQQAKLRAVLSEVNQYKTAFNAFKIQFNSLPGDITTAYSFWSNAAICANGVKPAGCNGNGDGYISVRGATPDFSPNSPVGQGDEELRAWQHLSLAGLVSGSYSGIATTLNQSDIGTNIPASKLSPGGYYLMTDTWGKYSWGSQKIYLGFGAFKVNYDPEGNILNPNDAYNIDVKTDDGFPINGNTLAAGQGGTNCFTGNTATAVYSLSTTGITCYMSFAIGP